MHEDADSAVLCPVKICSRGHLYDC